MSSQSVKLCDAIGIPTTQISSAVGEMVKILKTGKVPCLHGEAGIGKTASCAQLAKLLDKPLFTFVCSHMSETDVGIPFRSEGNKGYFEMLPPQQVYEAINSEKGAVLFFDEITRADKATLNAIFSILSERKVGALELKSNIDMVCAANPDDGNYSVQDIVSDPAWRRRLVHLWVETDAYGWLAYAKNKGFHKVVIEYIETKPHMLLGEEARNAGKIYPCPATWETVSKYLTENNDLISTIGLSGMVGYDVARDFMGFMLSSAYRVTPAQVLTDFDSAKPVLDSILADGRGDVLSELCKAVSMYLALNNPDCAVTAVNLFKFWSTLPEENIVVLSQEIEKENKGNNVNYYSLLYAELKKQNGWGKHLNKIKNIIKIK